MTSGTQSSYLWWSSNVQYTLKTWWWTVVFFLTNLSCQELSTGPENHLGRQKKKPFLVHLRCFPFIQKLQLSTLHLSNLSLVKRVWRWTISIVEGNHNSAFPCIIVENPNALTQTFSTQQQQSRLAYGIFFMFSYKKRPAASWLLNCTL